MPKLAPQDWQRKRKGTVFSFTEMRLATHKAISHMYEFVDKNGNYYVVLTANNITYIAFSQKQNDEVQGYITSRGNNVITGRGTNVVAFSNNLTFVQSIVTPYLTADLDNLDYTQDNDTLIITAPNYPQARIYISQYNGSSPPTFAYQVLDIYPLPAYDFNTINYNNFTVALSVSGSNVLTFQFTGLEV